MSQIIKTTKLGYWFLALNMQKYDELEMYVNRNFALFRKTKILREEKFLFGNFMKKLLKIILK